MSDVRTVRAPDVRPLRAAILRPSQPPDASVYPLDDRPETMHAGAFEAGRLVAVASVFREAPPGETDPEAWRLRGVATLEAARGLGYGAAVVRACEAHAREFGGARLWFNARTGAVGFYERLGYRKVGQEFDAPGLGPHWLMERDLG